MVGEVECRKAVRAADFVNEEAVRGAPIRGPYCHCRNEARLKTWNKFQTAVFPIECLMILM